MIKKCFKWDGRSDNKNLQAFCGMWVSIGPAVIVTTGSGHVTLQPGDIVEKQASGTFEVYRKVK